jgi:hypothetical protein
VLAWAPNVVSGWVAEDGTGTATSWDRDLDQVLAEAAASFPGLREACRGVFEARYSESAYVARAEALYGELSRARA